MEPREREDDAVGGAGGDPAAVCPGPRKQDAEEQASYKEAARKSVRKPRKTSVSSAAGGAVWVETSQEPAGPCTGGAGCAGFAPGTRERKAESSCFAHVLPF